MTTSQAVPDTGFKLRELIREVLTESTATDRDELAREVLDRIPPYGRETALFQALRTLVRESTAGKRPSFVPPSLEPSSEPTPLHAHPSERDGRQWLRSDGTDVEEQGEAQQRVREAQSVRKLAPRPATSPNQSAVRDAWQRALSQRMPTQDGDKFLRDCTIIDLERAAEERERLARRVADRATDLRHLVEVMRQQNAKTLGDVPLDVAARLRDTVMRVAA